MMDPSTLVTLVAIKICGATAGAILALIYLQPKTMAEFVTRSAFSVISGVVFSEGAREWLKWPATTNYEIASATLTALLSWFVMSAIVKMIETWKPK